MTSLHLIGEFLGIRRFAMVGVSRNPRDFSRRLFSELIGRGYDVVPVNPGVNTIEGRRCFRSVLEIEPRVSSALVMTPRPITGRILTECADAGITLAWLYGISGERDLGPDALAIGANRGIKIVPGYCPFMFLPGASFPHRLHGFVWEAIGRYPN
jgi:predicted CoA-binding protein